MLSKDAREAIRRAVTEDKAATEISDAIDSGANEQAADVADVSQADAATQTASYVEADVQSIADLANANKSKINEILAALKAAGLMA